MLLELAGIDKQVRPDAWLYPLDLTLQEPAITILQGAMRAGKAIGRAAAAGRAQAQSQERSFQVAQ